MNSYQRRLYIAALKTGHAFGRTYGSTWGGQKSTGGSAAEVPTLAALPSATIYFVPAAFIRARQALADVEIFSADYVGIPVGTIEAAPDHIRTNGSDTAMIIRGVDTSLGFQLFAADLYSPYPPALGASGQAGFRSPLWILGLSA